MTCRHPDTSQICSTCTYRDDCGGWLEDDLVSGLVDAEKRTERHLKRPKFGRVSQRVAHKQLDNRKKQHRL